MKALAITLEGLESITAEEIRSLLSTTTTTITQGVLFDVTKKEEAFLVAYKSQTVSRVLLVTESFTACSLNDAKKFVKKSYDFLLSPYTITCTRRGTHDFNSQDIIDVVKTRIKNKTFVYKNFRSVLHVFVIGTAWFIGEDISGLDLSKRDYKIFSNRQSLRGTFAAALVRWSEFSEKKVFLDPFCRDGVVAIEAALLLKDQSPLHFQHRKVLFSDWKFPKEKKKEGTIIASDSSFQNISAAKKNAAIAGVQKSVQFRKYALEDMDIKFDNESIDSCVIVLPRGKEIMMKVFKESIRPLSFIMKKKGIIIFVSYEFPLELPKEFKELERKEILQGKGLYYVLKTKKS